ncbi:MAG: symmetrical bis(5'-nucleosyl)-tetraphosphatase [Gammaproteobacteria bacterium]|nr:symmetrical bis(5'-nucleosyl)-tetraphosphatase [Gammaproteobacteria bacterium]
MAIYAIGDVQGCFDALRTLLDRIGFVPEKDRLWFTGDLVNRGRQSAEVLRLVRDLGDRAVSVLGNHDLHLLAVAIGAKRLRRDDTLTQLLRAGDCDELLHWLRRRPLLVQDTNSRDVLVHAGLLPQWDVNQALALAAEVEQVLQSDAWTDLLPHLYGNHPDQWSDSLQGWDRLRLITNVFTRMRYCSAPGRLALGEKGAPGQQSHGLTPWFAVTDRRCSDCRIIFGHWSDLGLWQDGNVLGLDSGCVWGGRLSAARLDVVPTKIITVSCEGRC